MESYVEIKVGIIVDKIAASDTDVYATRFGVPAGQWATVNGAWKARTMTAEYGTPYWAAFNARLEQRKKEQRGRR